MRLPHFAAAVVLAFSASAVAIQGPPVSTTGQWYWMATPEEVAQGAPAGTQGFVSPAIELIGDYPVGYTLHLFYDVHGHPTSWRIDMDRVVDSAHTPYPLLQVVCPPTGPGSARTARIVDPLFGVTIASGTCSLGWTINPRVWTFTGLFEGEVARTPQGVPPGSVVLSGEGRFSGSTPG